jgi:hypothetical protein
MILRKSLIWATAAVALLASCGSNDDYRLFVYPSKHDLSVHREFGPYKSMDEARDEAATQMTKYPRGDYEIGKNCRKREGISLWVCEETVK